MKWKNLLEVCISCPWQTISPLCHAHKGGMVRQGHASFCSQINYHWLITTLLMILNGVWIFWTYFFLGINFWKSENYLVLCNVFRIWGVHSLRGKMAITSIFSTCVVRLFFKVTFFFSAKIWIECVWSMRFVHSRRYCDFW